MSSAELRAAPLRVRLTRTRPFAAATLRPVVVGTALYAVVLLVAAVVAYRAYDVARFDLGNMVQAVWSTAHGHLLEQTSASGAQTSRLGSHVDPFLALLAPLWLVAPSPLTLVVVQLLAVASGAFPVYALARRHGSSERRATRFAFAYLLYPATQFNALGVNDGFHAVSLAVPLILFAIWFLDGDRLVPFAVFGLLAASTKEEIGAAVGCLGIWYAVRRRHVGAGVGIFVVGLGITLVDFLVVLPHYAATGASPFAGRYVRVGGTPTGIVHTAFTDPAALIHSVATWHKALYCVLLLAPFLALWALEPLLLLGAVPDLAINLLSSKPEQTEIYWQYTAGIVPFVVAAAVLGHARLRRGAGVATVAMILVAALLAVVSPLTRVVVNDIKPAAAHAAKSDALALIPRGAAVSASNKLGGMLSERRRIDTFPVTDGAAWVIVDRADSSYGAARPRFLRKIALLDAAPRWRVVYRSHGIEVLRRRP